MFIKTEEAHAVGVMMKMTAELWIRLEKDISMERRKRDSPPIFNTILNLTVELDGEEW